MLDEITEELIADVTTTLRTMLTHGFKRYPDQRWLGQRCNVHLKHALAHLVYMWVDDDTSKRPENDYANALMRIAMAQYVKMHYIAPKNVDDQVEAEPWFNTPGGPPVKQSERWLTKEKP